MTDSDTLENPGSAADAAYLLRADDEGVTTLTLNRPDELNALSEGMLAALQTELDAIAADRSVRVVVLEGEGRAFCAGHNLKQMRANYTLEYQNELFATCSKMMQSVLRLPQPVIAKVSGLATAAGCQLVATCDLAIAGQSSRFATSGINVGLFCSTPGVAVGRSLARKHAMDLLLTGDFVSAERAAEIALINEAVADEHLDDAVGELARKLANKSRPRAGAGQAGLLQAARDGHFRRLCLCGRRDGPQHDGPGRRRGHRRLRRETRSRMGPGAQRSRTGGGLKPEW